MPTLLHRVLDRARWEWREWRTPSAPSFLQEELDHALLDLVEWRPGERVLDVGCARGQYLQALFECGTVPTGIDIDLRALAEARLKGRAEQPAPSSASRFALADVRGGAPAEQAVRALAASGEALPFADRSFDALVCHKTMHLFPHPQAAAREFDRVLCPGGRVVFSTSNRASPYARVAASAIHGGRHPNWGSANTWSLADWCRVFAALGLRTRQVYSCNLVWPLVFRVCDQWIIPNEWMRRYNRGIRRLTRLPLATAHPLGAALDYVVVLQKRAR